MNWFRKQTTPELNYETLNELLNRHIEEHEENNKKMYDDIRQTAVRAVIEFMRNKTRYEVDEYVRSEAVILELVRRINELQLKRSE